MLHMHPHLLVDGFGKLGIDVYAAQTFNGLVKHNGDYVGSRTVHGSELNIESCTWLWWHEVEQTY